MLNSQTMHRIFAYLFTVLFGLLLAAVLSSSFARPVEVFVFFVLFASSVGLIFRKDWARKLIRATSLAGIFYFVVKQLIILRTLDVTSLATMGILAFALYVYRGVPARVQATGTNAWTVLVIDDDFTFVKLVRAHFVKQGLNVLSSDSGERGIEMAKRWRPDLIILDVILPGMKGRSVCAKLKEDSSTENIPVIFVTFKNSLDDISAEMELGAVMHLTKPVDYENLYAQVIKILGKK